MINIVASRYAEALFQVGEETDSTDKLYGELKAVVDIVKENKDFSNILRSPLVSKEEKKVASNIMIVYYISFFIYIYIFSLKYYICLFFLSYFLFFLDLLSISR